MKIESKDFRVPEGEKIKLKKWSTNINRYFESKKDYQEMLETNINELDKLQRLMYADDRYSLLLIFQGMDAAGKDGAIRKVLSGINPQGCQVFSFKAPSATELDHDFLWRTTCSLPERGRIGIFNRSYYEEVIVVRVHPTILDNQNIPDLPENKHQIWTERFESIKDLEKHLHRNGTRIIKFFLHVSKEEQRKRFLERIDNPEKNWKFSRSDVEERQFWDDYMNAFENCLEATSTKDAPWYVIPADDKENAHLIISQIVIDTMAKMKMSYPESDLKRRMELAQFREMLLE